MPFLYGNPRFDKNVVFAHAIRITWEASQSFKPELGYDFSTYLRHFIPNRLYDAFGIKKLKQDVEPDILKTEPVRFVGGGNGARLVLDTGDLVVGARMRDNELGYLTGVLERLRDILEPARSDLLTNNVDDLNAHAFLRALVDHAERREREAIAEAEQGGGLVLLEARDLQADVRLFKDNRLLRFKPALAIEDWRSNSVFQHIGSYQTEQAPELKRGFRLRGPFGNFKGSGEYQKPPLPRGAVDFEAEELDELAVRSGLNENEQLALVFMRDPYRGRDRMTDTEIAELIGVSQGYYSKLKHRVTEKMREANKKFGTLSPLDCVSQEQDHSTTWISGDSNDD